MFLKNFRNNKNIFRDAIEADESSGLEEEEEEEDTEQEWTEATDEEDCKSFLLYF